jgi:putative copper export protein
MGMMDVVNVAMRWLHISSMAILVGGLLFLWIGFAEAEGAAAGRAAAGYRRWFLTAAVLVLISGSYNFWHKTQTTVLSPAYHVVIGIKLLLVLHVLTAGFLATRASNPRRRRQAAGAAITGFVILALSATLRQLSM